MGNFKCKHCGRVYSCPTCGRPYKSAKEAAECAVKPKGKNLCDRCKKNFAMAVGAAMAKRKKN